MFIYKITNLINNKCYVGLTTRSVEQRWKEHCSADSLIGKAIRKYGIECFAIEILAEAETVEELEALEIQYIGEFRSFGEGYNLTVGGGNPILSNETKKKISENNARYWSGKTFSKEMKEKLSESHKGKTQTIETIKKRTASYQKSVIQYSIEGVLIKTYSSIADASVDLYIDYSSISKVCRGKRKTAGGFIWKYADNLEAM
jgi:group I intron endonuclease